MNQSIAVGEVRRGDTIRIVEGVEGEVRVVSPTRSGKFVRIWWYDAEEDAPMCRTMLATERVVLLARPPVQIAPANDSHGWFAPDGSSYAKF